MNSWFQAKVRYTKQNENGALKRVTEPYLLTAMSYTDAETRVYEELGNVIKGEFAITGIVPKNYIDVIHFDTENEIWFEIQVRTISDDIDSGKSKTITQKYLVSSSNIKEAIENLEEQLKTLTISESEIIGISETNICDVFPYVEDLDKEISRTDIESHTEFEDELLGSEIEEEEELI